MNAFQQDNHLWADFEALLPECATYIEESGISMGQELISEIDYDPCDDMNIGIWLKKQYDFIKQLPEVLRNWAEQIDIDKKPKYNFTDEDIFFSFNYTDTLEILYGIEDVLHIHGDVGKNDILIIGHGDTRDIERAKEIIHNSRGEYNEYTTSTFDTVKTYLESTLKDTDAIIESHKKWFDGLIGIDEVYIIGHSLGNVDLPYFKKINECIGEKAEWILCYHSKRDETKEKKLIDLGIKRVKSMAQTELYDVPEP